jgi:hypothetical protein
MVQGEEQAVEVEQNRGRENESNATGTVIATTTLITHITNTIRYLYRRRL